MGESLTSNYLNFGVVEMNSKEKIDFIIKNFNENLPLEIEFGQMANFSMFPKMTFLLHLNACGMSSRDISGK